MAPVYSVCCNSCDYRSRDFFSAGVIAIDDRGWEHTCHSEIMVEKITQRPLSMLKSLNRLYDAAPAFCNGCGCIEYYRANNLEVDLDSYTGIREWLQQLSCKACGENNLSLARNDPDELRYGFEPSIFIFGMFIVGIIIQILNLPRVLLFVYLASALFFLLWKSHEFHIQEKQRFQEMICPECHKHSLCVKFTAIS
jgi:hypothetical protein